MAKKKNKEDGAKIAPPKPGAQPSPAALSPEADAPAAPVAGHDDAAQDIALIKQMLQDTFGDDIAGSDDHNQMASQMHQNAIKAGCSPEEAANCAKYGMMAAKHEAEFGAKADPAAAPADDKQAPPDAAAKDAPPADDKKAPPFPKKEAEQEEESEKKEDGTEDESEESEEKKKENEEEETEESENEKESEDEGKKEVNAIRAQLAKVTAENAKLKESVEVNSRAQHIEKLCRESGLKVKVTKGFKELVEGVQSIEQINKTWKIFKETFEKSGSDFSESLTFATEKTVVDVDSAEGGISFDGCLNK